MAWVGPSRQPYHPGSVAYDSGGHACRPKPFAGQASATASPVGSAGIIDEPMGAGSVAIAVERQIGQRTSSGIDLARQIEAEIGAVAMPRDRQPRIPFPRPADQKTIAV